MSEPVKCSSRDCQGLAAITLVLSPEPGGKAEYALDACQEHARLIIVDDLMCAHEPPLYVVDYRPVREGTP